MGETGAQEALGLLGLGFRYIFAEEQDSDVMLPGVERR